MQLQDKALFWQRKSSPRPIHRLRTAGLQGQMTLSYIWVTTIVVLILEILVMIGLALILLLVIAPFVYTLEAQHVALRYALAASLQAKTAALDPQSTFQAGQTGTLTPPGRSNSRDTVSIPYITTQAPNTNITITALLIAPDGTTLASSYPQRYPAHTQVSSLLASKSLLITKALMGTEDSGQETALTESSVYAVEPVWSRQVQPIGAIYVQITKLPSIRNVFTMATPWLILLFIAGLVSLALLTPISGLFGMLTTRALIRRVHILVKATSRFAAGDYTQRISLGRPDEIGQLEQHFNRMALQLSESIQQQHILTEQNARFAERARMSRDLHDSIKQQVFALATQIGTALALFDHKREETRAHLEIASEQAYQVRQELTALIQEMRPSILIEKRFDQMLRDELERWSRQNDIPLDTQLQDMSQLPSTIAKELLRVVQEALSNVARHSQATSVQISLEQEQEQTVLTIADNGRGFDRMTVSPQSVGLQSMQERVEEIDGTFQLQSSIGQGTQIKVCYPRFLSTTSDAQGEMHNPH